MRTTIYPENHWSLKVDIPYSMGVKQGDLFALCGQADLKGMGEIQNAGDLYEQSKNAIQHIKNLVRDLGCKTEDLTKLVVYYVNNHDVDEITYCQFLADQLAIDNLPVITFVPLTHFFYPGVMVEIDAYGLDSSLAERIYLPGEHSPFSQAVRQGEFIFVGAITSAETNDIVSQSHAVLAQLDAILGHFGASRNDIVKINNWYVGGGDAESWAESARVRTEYYPEPGPVATGLPAHTLFPKGVLIQTDCWIMLGTDNTTLLKQHAWPEGHWDWPIHLPFKHGLRCGNMVFVGGQVSMNPQGGVDAKNDMLTQSHTSMKNIGKVIELLGCEYKDIFKMNCFYKGSDNPDDLHANVDIRSGYFEKPGPASTGIPLNYLAYEGMVTEFETIAIVEE